MSSNLILAFKVTVCTNALEVQRREGFTYTWSNREVAALR